MISKRPRSKTAAKQFPIFKAPTVFLDSETLPTEDTRIIQRIVDEIKPPGNYKKAETIAEWEKQEKPKLIEEAVHRTGLDGSYGRVCCISYAFNDGPTMSHIGEEKEVLSWFFDQVDSVSRLQLAVGDDAFLPLTVCGHAVRTFDLRFLWQRAAVQGVRRSPALPWNVSRYDPRIQDTMEIWNPDKRISLHDLCLILGVPSPKDQGVDGSMVWDLWRAGRRSAIARYCEGDVEAVRDCWCRMVSPGAAR